MRAVAGHPVAVDVEEYRTAAKRFAVAVAWSDMRAPVPSCPGWSTYDLVAHLGNVHAWAATIVETGQAAAEQNDEPRSTRGKVVSQWYAAKAEDLYQVLRSSAPDQPCWNFAVARGGVAAFWPRRQLHETTIHQVDLDHACGRPAEVSASVAADGVSEVLGVMLNRMHQRGYTAHLDRPLALTATDTGDTWVVEPKSGPPSVEHQQTRISPVADRLEARADVLYRMLWHRPYDQDAVRVSGDEARVQTFLRSKLTP